VLIRRGTLVVRKELSLGRRREHDAAFDRVRDSSLKPNEPVS